MDTVKSILRGQTVVTVDTTNYDVVVETIPTKPDSSINDPSSLETSMEAPTTATNASYLLELYSNVLSSGKAGYTLNCSHQESSSNGKPFVHVLSPNWSKHSSFTYIPTYHIICTLTQDQENGEKDRVSLNMIMASFSGHLIAQQNETLTFVGVTKGEKVEEESMIAACSSSNLLKRFSEGKFQLCRGVSNCHNIENTLKAHGLLYGNIFLS